MAYVKEGLSASTADRRDMARAETLIDRLWGELGEWRVSDRGEAGSREGPLDVEGLHGQARELANLLGKVRRRHAKRREARERRGSVLEG